ncbi:MAG TPA: STAS domain-containing protein [Spirochaetota bacterium]|nr:STAS domain-containing protein [Spirochaetota bacterium]HOD13900.1 STAS domain-containing protein [Spirochaetota bacterium]HPG49696.1 STAS domain-containing protein [Spirochaetota bacterium]HPN13590.1 STAS domain-containing protein [Spirochaetota bacterium]
MVSRILYLTKRKDETIDYNSLVVVIRAVDIMDMDGVGDMSLFMRTLITGGAKKIAVDMEKLTFIDSSGIAVLIEAAKMLRQKRGDIVLLNVPSRIRTIFNPVRMNRFISCFESESDVRKYFVVT